MSSRPGSSPPRSAFRPRQEDRFGANDWSRGEFGAPVLQESLGVFECERYAVHDGGDHHILVGHVVKASFDARARPPALFPRPLPPAALRLVDDQFFRMLHEAADDDDDDPADDQARDG